MKNLENFGVQELNSEELQHTEGGLMILGALAVGLAVAYLAGTVVGLANGGRFGGQP